MTSDLEWWRTEAKPEDIWNGPGDGVDEHLVGLVPTLGARLDVPGATGLDLGCGWGRLTAPMAHRFPWANFTGLDVVERTGPQPWPANATRLTGNGTTIPLPDASVDAAWSVLCFQHLPAETVRGYIAEVARVLAPGGCFVAQFASDEHAPDEPRCYQHAPAVVQGWARDVGLPSLSVMHLAADPPTWWWLIAGKP